jgi:hypothetical protein
VNEFEKAYHQGFRYEGVNNNEEVGTVTAETTRKKK